MDIVQVTDNLLGRLASTSTPLQQIAGRLMFSRITKELSDAIVDGDRAQIMEVSKRWVDYKSRFNIDLKDEMKLAKAIFVKASRLTSDIRPGCKDSPVVDPRNIIESIYLVPSRMASLGIVQVVTDVAASCSNEKRRLRIFEPVVVAFASLGDGVNFSSAVESFSDQLSDKKENLRSEFFEFCAKQAVLGDKSKLFLDRNGLYVCGLASASECFDRQVLITSCINKGFFLHYFEALSFAVSEKKIDKDRLSVMKTIAKELNTLGQMSNTKLKLIESLNL